jgi:hypothetical protein
VTIRFALATALCLAATVAAGAAELSWGDKLTLQKACGNDLKALCGAVERGDGRMMQCIADNRSKLSTQCAATIAPLRDKLGWPMETDATGF